MDPSHEPQLLARALGHTTKEGIAAIADVLAYFGISPPNGGTELEAGETHAIPIDPDHERSFRAVFNSKSREWRLEGSPEPGNHAGQSKVTNGQFPRYAVEEQTSPTASENPTNPPPSNMADWTTHLGDTEHVRFMKSRDWASTALGPMQQWPISMQVMTLKMHTDPRPASIYWGPSRIAIYNEEFLTLAHGRHPAMMGSTAKAAMPAMWPRLKEVFEKIERSNSSVHIPEFEMNGLSQEVWYEGHLSPIRDVDGKILGLYNSGNDKTQEKIARRRSRLLHHISATPNFQQVSPWKHIVEACREYDRDVPLLAVYSVTALGKASSPNCSLHLEGAFGLNEDHPAIPETIELADGTAGFVPALRLARAKESYVFLDRPDGQLPEFLAHDVQWRGFGLPATHLVAIPLYATGSLGGFIIMGLNPKTPFDELHREFVEDIGRVSTGLIASSISVDQANAREKILADNITAREKLVNNIARVVTVGIFSINMDGMITWANSKFYELTGMSDKLEDSYNFAIFEHVLEDDRERAMKLFEIGTTQQTVVEIEVRMQGTWTPPGTKKKEPRWMFGMATPNIENGKMTGLVGCLTDISNLKWAEQLQINSAEAAKQAKIQQEKFVDMTSHEIRNPLSAILQCADDICTLSQKRKSAHNDREAELFNEDETFDEDVMHNITENAQTILFCAAHQKRIIDDILTVSKLDSSVLLITPICVDPVWVATKAMQMYETELIANDINFSFTKSQSFLDLGLKWFCLDPSRLTQVLINLLTNAIKFTKSAEKREIHVRLGASKLGQKYSREDQRTGVDATDTPAEFLDVSGLDETLEWFPAKETAGSSPPESYSEDELDLIFEVEDTGKGISADEMGKLFNRFIQANSKTHVQYGGSGLGLFISRELVELHGGMIGAASQPAQGSIFAFYLKVRRAQPEEIVAVQKANADSDREQVYCRKHTPAKSQNPIPIRPKPTSISKIDPGLARRKGALSLLLVEDNVVNQQVLSRQLRRSGYTVQIANHGVEALDFLKSTEYWKGDPPAAGDHVVTTPIDVVLMDWEMPIMDGLTCTRQIRALEKQGLLESRVPVIATTANARPAQVQMAMEAGVDDFLAKPFTVQAIIERIDMALGKPLEEEEATESFTAGK